MAKKPPAPPPADTPELADPPTGEFGELMLSLYEGHLKKLGESQEDPAAELTAADLNRYLESRRGDAIVPEA